MKRLHRSDLFGWSCFDEARDVDFNSVAWVRPAGNVLVDPLPLGEHDFAHLEKLGGAAVIVITNSDHVRAAGDVRARTGARVLGPRAEQAGFPVACDAWLGEGDEVVPGLSVVELFGSKTPGELALVLEKTTLITGDLVRAHQGGRLNLLPEKKLADRARAVEGVKRLAADPDLDAVLVGDGWPVFRGGGAALRDLVLTL